MDSDWGWACDTHGTNEKNVNSFGLTHESARPLSSVVSDEH
jgi:hypothetical protein